MKRLLLALLALSFAGSVPEWACAKDVRVRGYTRKDGTYVRPHRRSSPDGIFSNNWSTKGNVNPYTGKPGWLTKPPDSNGSDVRVRGYTRKDGTYVPSHMRSAPDGNFSNNWSTRGNVNPYTRKPGWLTRPPDRSAGSTGTTFGRATVEPDRRPAVGSAPRRSGAGRARGRRTENAQVDPFLREAFGDPRPDQDKENADIELPPRVPPRSTELRPEPLTVVRRPPASDLAVYRERMREDEERRRWAFEFERQRRGRGMTDPERHSLRTYGQRRW